MAYNVLAIDISMINTALFAFLTGLHLAILQFNYFFLLLINITSTYITYAAVVLSWMAGTLIGLLWKRLNAVAILIAGVASYYCIYALVMSDPFSGSTLPIACLGVAVTGLWAGRFFVVMRPLFGRADRLFFHENNGFLLGIMGVFIGFTLLGKGFLLWTPLISGAGLLPYLAWLLAHAREFESRAMHGLQTSVVPSRAFTPMITDMARHQAGKFAVMICVLNLLFPVGALIYAGLTGEEFSAMFLGERNAITWFSSIQLVVIGLLAYAIYETVSLLCRFNMETNTRRQWIWLVFAFGFIFLGLDERFQFHEALRDDVIQPRDLFVGIPYVGAGDVGLYLFFGAGLTFTWFLIAELRHRPIALVCFVSALLLTISTIAIDGYEMSIPLEQRATLRIFWASVFEEVGEIWAQLLFLLSFIIILRWRLGQLSLVPDTEGRGNFE